MLLLLLRDCGHGLASDAQDGHDFLFPTAKIKDNIKDGGEVTVTLVRQRTLDERNAPDTSIWAALAFSHSEATQEKCEAPWPRRGDSALR